MPPTSSASRAIGPDDDLDEEDTATIAAAMGKATGHLVPDSTSVEGAKVSSCLEFRIANIHFVFDTVHQMRPVRQDIQGRKFGQFPC